MRKAFTLIELLIVIAIIAILALIAVPNFLEAQTRAKVSRVMADLRTAATALEAYAVDWGAYPIPQLGSGSSQHSRSGFIRVTPLSTPVAYLTTTNLKDPFSNLLAYNEYGKMAGGEADRYCTFHYINIRAYGEEQTTHERAQFSEWGLISLGPDYVKGPNPDQTTAWLSDYGKEVEAKKSANFTTWTYDASNGTVSSGDIFRFQGWSRD